MNFTVLQSVYNKDKPEFLWQSLKSIADNTVQPESIVLVKDGKLSDALETVITEWKSKLPLKVVGYEQNRGLAYALSYGLKFVETDLVARMDSDDICYKDRFEKQITFLKKYPDIVLLSGYIDEFNDNPDIIVSTRTVPLSHDEIKQYLKKRNAFNHMAVMFMKKVVIECGNYQQVPYFEDYDLWVRIVKSGYKTANIPEKLIKARIGNDMIGRRHGLTYSKHEVYFLRRLLNYNFISEAEFIKLLFLRVPLRLLPKAFLKLVYKVLRK